MEARMSQELHYQSWAPAQTNLLYHCKRTWHYWSLNCICVSNPYLPHPDPWTHCQVQSSEVEEHGSPRSLQHCQRSSRPTAVPWPWVPQARVRSFELIVQNQCWWDSCHRRCPGLWRWRGARSACTLFPVKKCTPIKGPLITFSWWSLFF